MQMSEQEIINKYTATDPKERKGYISILAQLNACPEDDIRGILKAGGLLEESVSRPKKRGRKTAGIQQEQKDEMHIIPDAVKRLCRERLGILTDQIIALEKERDALSDYLNEVTKDEQ